MSRGLGDVYKRQILACGGFLLTNFQSEIPEYFEIGTDLETYASEEELSEKCQYYLTHEEERKQIAENGYRKVKEFHSLEQRLAEMMDLLWKQPGQNGK